MRQDVRIKIGQGLLSQVPADLQFIISLDRAQEILPLENWQVFLWQPAASAVSGARSPSGEP